MLILPAIDLFEGKCVRLRQGDFNQQTTYSEHPEVIARSILEAGLSHVHVVDLEGAKHGTIRNWQALEAILSVGLDVEIGGGIRTSDDIAKLLDMGVGRVILGSVAAKSPSLVGYWIKQFGADKIAIGVDVKNNSVAIRGWLENSHVAPTTLILELLGQGATTFICTDIARDGLMRGPNIEFYRALRIMFKDASLVASGGITSLEDIGSLKELGLAGVIIGKAWYEGRVTLAELKGLGE